MKVIVLGCGLADPDLEVAGGLADAHFVPGSRAGFVGDCLGSVQPYLDFNAGAEAVDDRHEAIHGEAAEVGVADAREVGGGNAGAGVRGANRQVFPVERLDDFSREDRLELFSIGAILPQIAEHIAASPHYFQLSAFHRSISFNRLSCHI
jgi:hypothetical protein